jgi:MoxR-like ATPase
VNGPRKNLLLTGPPGCGKTTVIRVLHEPVAVLATIAAKGGPLH